MYVQTQHLKVPLIRAVKSWQQVLEAVAHIVFTVSKQSEMHADAQLTSSFFFVQHFNTWNNGAHIYGGIYGGYSYLD